MTELEKLKAGLEYCYDDAEVDARKESSGAESIMPLIRWILRRSMKR